MKKKTVPSCLLSLAAVPLAMSAADLLGSIQPTAAATVSSSHMIVAQDRNPVVRFELRGFEDMWLPDACDTLGEFYATVHVKPRYSSGDPVIRRRVFVQDFDPGFGTGLIGDWRYGDHFFDRDEVIVADRYGEEWVEVWIDLWEDDDFWCGGGDDHEDLNRRRVGDSSLQLRVNTDTRSVWTVDESGSWYRLGNADGRSMSVRAMNQNRTLGVRTHFSVNVSG